MLALGIILLGLGAAGILIFRRIPEGWEDESGFHLGKHQ